MARAARQDLAVFRDAVNRRAYPFADRWFRVPAGRMHFVDEGHGPPVLFVHGTPTWSFEWRHLIRCAPPHPPVHRRRPPGVRALRSSPRLSLHPGGPRRELRRVRRRPRARRPHARGPRLRRAHRLARLPALAASGAAPGPPQHLDVELRRRPRHGAEGPHRRQRAREVPLREAQLLPARDHALRLRRPAQARPARPPSVPRALSRPRPRASACSGRWRRSLLGSGPWFDSLLAAAGSARPDSPPSCSGGSPTRRSGPTCSTGGRRPCPTLA